MTFVETENWVTKTAELKEERFEILIAVDQIKNNKIELHLLTQKQTHIYTTISRDEIQIAPSITNVFPAASWSEREISEGFGIQFDTQESNQPLLLKNSAALEKAPMRRDTFLKQRNENPWPGAKEPNNEKSATRRKTFPIGAVDNPEKTV